MSGPIREARLAPATQQYQDGRYVSPIPDTLGLAGIREYKVLFSQLTIDDTKTLAGNDGYLIYESGYAVQISPTSDSATVVYVSLDDGNNFFRMKPGDLLEMPNRFDRIYLKKPSTLPSTGQLFWVTVYLTRGVKTVAGSPRQQTPSAGATNFVITATANPSTTTPATNVCPFRSNRTRVLLKNEGTGDVWIGPASNVTSPAGPGAAGERLASGEEALLYITSDIYAIASASNNLITAREEYTT
jgi:hypothetical protein